MRVLGLQISFGRKTPPTPAPVQKAITWDASMFDSPDGAPVLVNAYQQVVWVYRCVNALAESVANIPFRFSRSGAQGGEVINSGPLIEFYDRPNPQMNRFQYWELRVMWLMLRGECFRIPIRDLSGRLQSVIMPDPSRFTEIVQNGELVGWRYVGREGALMPQVLLPEEVWHDKLANPFSPWRGMAPLTVASIAAASDYAAGLVMKGLMENNGEAGLIFRTSEPLDPEQREQILSTLRERKRRAGTADRPVLLCGGTELLTPKLSSSDAQFLTNRQFSRAEICSAFGVPEEIITTTDKAKFDVMAGARLNFIENRVVPLCRRLQAEEVTMIRQIDPRARGWFDTEDHPVLAASRRERLTAARAGFEMGIPLNDLNRSFDLGFRPFPWGDLGYVASSVQPIMQPHPTP